MSWTTSSDLRTQVERLWARGELLRSAVSNCIVWPLRLTLKTPNAADLSDRFVQVREWVNKVGDTPYLRIEWRDWNHRLQGTQRLPEEAWIDSLADALAFISKSRQAQLFEAMWRKAHEEQPSLQPWLVKRPLQALEMADRWDRLLAIIAWLQAHPRPAVYLRQVDAPGVDTKFIEAHRGVLTELLDLALPPEVIEATATGAGQFNRRFGFLEKPVRIRFRLLDPELSSLNGCTGLPDITLDEESFGNLALPIERVFITENETNFLAFPQFRRAIVLFGAGYGWEPLARATWLHQCKLHYWGDIDTHGFAIADQLRSYFPHVVTFLMDRETLLVHRVHWGEETSPTQQELPRLKTEEAEVYDDLRFDRIQPRLRLEQERVGFTWASQRLLEGWS